MVVFNAAVRVSGMRSLLHQIPKRMLRIVFRIVYAPLSGCQFRMYHTKFPFLQRPWNVPNWSRFRGPRASRHVLSCEGITWVRFVSSYTKQSNRSYLLVGQLRLWFVFRKKWWATYAIFLKYLLLVVANEHWRNFSSSVRSVWLTKSFLLLACVVASVKTLLSPDWWNTVAAFSISWTLMKSSKALQNITPPPPPLRVV